MRSDVLVSNPWIDSNLPSVGSNKSMPLRSRMQASGAEVDATRDVRLLTDPNIPVFRANATTDDTPLDLTPGEQSSSNAKSPSDQKEVNMEVESLPMDKQADIASGVYQR